MNETHCYDPESFHPSLMHSVHVALEGSRLCLGYPQANIPRWASFDEVPHEASLSRLRTYQLANSKVCVLFATGQLFVILGSRDGGGQRENCSWCVWDGFEIQKQGDPFHELSNLVCLQSDRHPTLK